MKIFSNGLVTGSLLMLIMISSLQADTIDSYEVPESIVIDYLAELYSPVVFDHQMHSDMYDCNSCHHHTTGTEPQEGSCSKCHTRTEPAGDVSCSGCHIQSRTVTSSPKEPSDTSPYHIDMVSLKGALHLGCLGCHRAEGGPVDCEDCHTFTQAGKQRFALKN